MNNIYKYLYFALVVASGCAREGASPPSSSEALEGASREASREACGSCHATGLPTPTAWLAASVYPELIGAGRLPEPPGGEALEVGWSRLVPTDVTWAEWEAWQALSLDRQRRGWEAPGLGQGCGGCHGLGGGAPGGPHPSWGPASPSGADAVGVWASGDTWRRFVRATIKVQSFGAGHRAPVAPGARWVLRVEATDERGARLAFVRGPVLPAEAGALAGEPGFFYARRYGGPSGASQLTPEGAMSVLSDTRLQAWEHDELHFIFELPASGSWRLQAELEGQGPGGEVLWSKRAAAAP